MMIQYIVLLPGISVGNSLCMDMFVFRVDLAAFIPQMNKASVLNHACFLLSTLPRPLIFLGDGSFTLTANGCAAIKH